MSDDILGAPRRGGAPSHILDHVLTGLNTIGSAWIFVLMLMIDAGAFGRTVFAHPITGVNELVELSIVGIVFMQLGDATRRGRLIRSDGFFSILYRRNRKAGRILGAVFEFLGVAFMLIVLYGAVPYMIEAYERDYFVGEVGLFTAPEWPIKVVIVVGCLVTMLQFLRIGIAYLRGTDLGPGQPVD